MRRRLPSLAGLLLAGLLLPAPGCYLLHVTAGQVGILLGREPIEEALTRPELDPTLRQRLEQVLAVRRFAAERLGLQVRGSYSSYYDTGGEPIAWNVSACTPDGFAPYVWQFPLVGVLPYKGFFARELAVEEARQLKALGLDILLLPVPAYSTLGWFDDPVFSSLLEEEEAWLVETILHELAHATVFIEADADFNENLATFLGREGALAFFRARGGDADPGLRGVADKAEDDRRFNAALVELRQELWRVYESSGPKAAKLAAKAARCAAFKTRYSEQVRPGLRDPERFDWVLSPELELNNALLLGFARYHGDLGLFEALQRRLGGDLPRTVARLVELAEGDDPRAALEAEVAAAVAPGG